MDYGAPFWYQAHNGLTTREQARQVQAHYKRPTPPSQAERDLMVQDQDMGQDILFLAQMPARTCINELVISPTHNRFYLGGLETPPPRT